MIGPNGTGKTHFMRLLAGEDVAHEGEWKLGARVEPALFAQLHERADVADLPIVEVLRKRGMTMTESMAALRRYEIDQVGRNPFEILSGGQQARFQLLLMEVDSPTMLLLDEPTDNLDVASADALQEAVDRYQGTVIAVTHDRWFMRLMDRFLFFDEDGSVRSCSSRRTRTSRRSDEANAGRPRRVGGAAGSLHRWHRCRTRVASHRGCDRRGPDRLRLVTDRWVVAGSGHAGAPRARCVDPTPGRGARPRAGDDLGRSTGGRSTVVGFGGRRCWPPPDDVELLVLHEQRIYRVLAADDRLAAIVLGRLGAVPLGRPHRTFGRAVPCTTTSRR